MNKINALIIGFFACLSLAAQHEPIREFSVSECIDDRYLLLECVEYEGDSVVCQGDSILMYTPIKFMFGPVPEELDTLSVLAQSMVLDGINEPRIYNESIAHDIIRFSWFRDTLPVFYRIEKTASSIHLSYKRTSGSFDVEVGEIIEEKSIEISEANYNKIISTLQKGNYWDMDEIALLFPRTLLIETHLDGEYYFINWAYSDIAMTQKHRKILNCIDFMDRLLKI